MAFHDVGGFGRAKHTMVHKQEKKACRQDIRISLGQECARSGEEKQTDNSILMDEKMRCQAKCEIVKGVG